MPKKRTEFHGEAGTGPLLFDWRDRRTPLTGMLRALAVATVVFVLPWMALRLQVAAPPVDESRRASMMLLAPGNDPLQWSELARERGPAPSRFDPAEWSASREMMDTILARAAARAIPAHETEFEDFPDEPPPAGVSMVMKGSRHLPPVAAPVFKAVEPTEVRSRPVLHPLSGNAERPPERSPEFHGEVTPEMASHPWRFLLQVGADGEVRHAVALTGHNTPGRSELTDWLRAHRFAAYDGDGGRWVAMAVTFHNQPTHGTDGP